MFKKYFLPIGLIGAVIFATLFPEPGIVLRKAGFISICLATIFLVNGWSVHHENFSIRQKFLSIICLSIFISLFLGPLLGWILVHFLPLTPTEKIAFITMAAVPVTLSSAIVLTQVSKGDELLAVYLSITLNLIGTLIVPWTLKYVLGSSLLVHFPVYLLILNLGGMVVLPFLVGTLCQKKLPPLPSWATWIPPSCVILTVYMVFASSQQNLQHLSIIKVMILLIAAISIHTSLFSVGWIITNNVIRLPLPESKAICFAVSQKTLPVAISILSDLGLTGIEAVLPCLIFHFSQLFLDSFLAIQWSKRTYHSPSFFHTLPL